MSLSSIGLKSQHGMYVGERRDLIFEDGKWGLHTTRNGTMTATAGWQTVISHRCEVVGSPYWMLIEYHDNKTVCLYCSEPMPPSIVALFKLQNERLIQ